MQLAVSRRGRVSKGQVQQGRRAGLIPAVLYAKTRAAEAISVDQKDFEKALRGIQDGALPTTVFTLQGLEGSVQALVKEVQYHKTTYQVQHIDLMELVPGHQVRVRIPIRLHGVVECAGVKAGGAVRQVLRHVTVVAEPADLPSEFVLDVRAMEIGDSLRAKGLDVPEKVRLLTAPIEVLAVVAKR